MITFKDLGNYGRFGNQLFQMASTIGIANRNNTTWGFPSWEYSSYFANPFPAIRVNNCREYVEKEPYYQDVDLDFRYNWNLKGYFQSWKYFYHCDKVIHHVFNFQRVYSLGVAVHVRRGDYLDRQHVHPVQTLDYYKRAMELFNGEHFTIFSDDIDWCKEHIQGYNIGYRIPQDTISDFKEMSGFSKFIIANSSYSWWAAYLSKSDKVVAPSNYVIGETRDDRIPDWWTKV